MKKLLICGDSFAADWTVKYQGYGWVNLLEQNYKITNLAQAGCSEYKILKQLQSVKKTKFDMILVSHTSPYRLYVKEHPVHSKDNLHKNSCLLYTDIVDHLPNNPKLQPIIDYFDNYFDFQYAEHIHNLLLQEIDFYCDLDKTLHISHINWSGLHRFHNFENFSSVFEKHRGIMNHYTNQGNEIVYERVLSKLRGLDE